MSAPRATAAQIATLLGVPKSTVLRRAEAERWTFEEVTGRGGTRREFLVEQLPAALRAQLTWSNKPADDTPPEARAARQDGKAQANAVALVNALEATASEARRQAALRQAAELGAAAQARMDSRIAIVRAYEAFLSVHQALGDVKARILFAEQYNTGAVAVAPEVRAAVPSTSASSIDRWRRDIRERGITALAGAYGNRSGSGKLDSQPALREFVTAMLVQYPHARATQVMSGLRSRFADGADLPSMRSLERWMQAWRDANREVLTALENPDAWKNRHMVAFGSASEGVEGINARWELDSSPADVMCTDGRYSLIGGIDVGTRRARLLVARTSKATAVAALLRDMLLAYGVPSEVKTDNGSDYTSLHVGRVLAALDVRQELCPPFQPWHKPHIERFFGTFARDLVELLPGYIGHSVAERQAIEARRSFADRLMQRGETVEVRMTGAELQAFADKWLDTIYHVRAHEGLARRSPFEVAAAQRLDVKRIPDDHALDILLAEAPGRDGRRTVQKKGIRLEEGWFIAPELEAWVGQEVQVRYDPVHHDLGTVFVFGGDDLRFICLAQCPERTGVDRRDVAVKAKALQKARVQEERRALKAAAKRAGVDEIVGEILRERAAAAGKLHVLPTRPTAANTHSSAGLEAAAQAASAAQAPQRTTAELQHLVEIQAARARVAEQLIDTGTPNDLAVRRGPTPTPVFETVADRIRWLMVQQRVRELTPEEAETLADYRRTQPASYRRMQQMVAEQLGADKENAPDRSSGFGAP